MTFSCSVKSFQSCIFSGLMVTHSVFGIKAGNMSMQLLFFRFEIALLHCAFLAILLPSGGQSHLVEFYGQENYTDFLNEIHLSDWDFRGRCSNIVGPYTPSKLFSSIKADRCLMFYSRRDCKADHYRKYPDPDVDQTFKIFKDEPMLDFELKEYISPLGAKSYRLCDQENGGPQVNVNVHNETYHQGSIVQQYKNLCGCQNLPISIKLGKTKPFSLDNRGNDVEVFSQEYCKGEKVKIPAGRNKYSLEAPTKHQFDVRSIRPANGHDCIKLNAVITKFLFENSTQNHLPQQMKLATTTKVRNNGAAKITQEYVLSERVVDTLDITVATAFTDIDSVDAFANFENKGSAGFEIFAKISFEFKYGITYAFQKTNTESKSNRVVNTTERTVSIKQSVDIPDCKECVLTSFLREMVDFPFKYTAFARLSGTGAGVPLTAAQVKQFLPDGAVYIRDYDANSIEMTAQGDMKADSGIEAFIDVDCQPIPGCGDGENNAFSNKKLKYQIPVPIN